MLSNLAPLALVLAQAPAPTLVLRNARVFDPEAQTLHAPADLWIAGERVLGERPLGTPTPASVEVRDVAGATLLPGLFDLHVHVAVAGSGMDAFARLQREDNLRSQLYCGVTHVVDLHDDQAAVFATRERSRTEPDLARLHCAGAAFTAPGGHGTQFGIPANAVTTVAEVNQCFDELAPLRPDVIKAILEHGEWGPVPKLPTLDATLFDAVAARARAAKLPLFAHVWTLDEARTAVEHGASVLAHGVFVGAVDDALASAMKTRGVAYVPTLSVVLGSKRAGSERSPYAHELTLGALGAELYENVASGHGSTWATSGDFAAGDRQWLANLKTLADAGVLLGTGTDAGNPLTPHGPALLEELALFVEAGLSPARTLRAATLDSARILGVERDFGSLAPGKIADVVVVRGEPSTTISDVWNVVDVFKSGVPFDRAAHARRLAAQAAGPAKARVGSDVPARIDDFDDGDVRSAYATEWTAASDTVAGGKSSATIAVRDGVLRVDGELRAGFAYGPFAGVALRFDATAERVADDDERAADDDERALGGGARAADPGERVLDAGDYDGVRLRVRGTERSWSFTLNRAAVKDFNGFATSLELGPEWKDVEIPFRTLQQLGVGKPVPWGAGDLVGLEIDARVPWGSNELGEFEFELDWIEFYRTP